MLRKDYYLTLGIQRRESPSGIRAAFRNLAKRYHPERIGWQGARFFEEILNAYRVLSDPSKRMLYDQGLLHAEGRSRGQSQETIIVEAGSRPIANVPQPLPLLQRFETVCPPPEEILQRIHRNYMRAASSSYEPVQSFNVQVILSPDEAAQGGMAQIAVPVFYPCPTCGGSGQDWLFPCSSCQAQGLLEEEEAVWIQIPPGVGDYTLMEIPVRGLGLHNMCARLYIRVMA